ncbi:hypothetical protein AB9T89_00015 [Flavobacterium oncorhynchi]|uniref:hypothetical protein n=1 Tax=Flavobacterium oncorhynchi TaxID=728056 RepID=UPI00351A04C2
MIIKKKFIIALFFVSISYAQQIGDGHAPETISDFSAPLKSGIYNGYSASTVDMVPDNSQLWQHLIAARHISTVNNYQLQIASSFAVNDRLFFRKIVSNSLSSSNSAWIELATRGANFFTGNQFVKGAILSSISDDGGGHIELINPTKSGNGVASSWMIYNMTGVYGNSLQFWAYDDLSCGGGMCSNRFTIMDNGNVGIGTQKPTNKLDVNGTIHSKEVKVDMNGWSDFVFKKDYNLPTLEEVEKHIAEKGHLENIPSEKEVLKDGINLGEMNAKLLQKIEEMTLYMIDFKKEMNELKIKNKIQEEEIKKLKRVDKI